LKSNNTGKLIVRLFVISLVLVWADLAAPAQNANSSTTTQEDASAQNSNSSGANMNSGRRRRGRRRSTAAPPNACMPGDATPTEVQLGPGQEFVTDRPVMMTGRCDPMAQEQTDLSGTYTGRVGYTDVVMAGDATLTITGNEFTLTNGQMTATGRIVAVTTCNYTAVTMRFGKDETVAAGQTPPPPPPTVSLRARRTSGGLFLDTVPGESHMFSFHSTGGRGGGRSEFRGGMKKGGPPRVGIKPPTVR
jgi:hypothetical protein